MVNQIEANYSEQMLLPPSVEDWIGYDHPARFIREIVSQIDLEEIGIRQPKLKTGRPPYSIRLLLRVWLYGYWKRIRSSRKLEESCKENLAFIWLCGMKYPDHNTLWRFFKKNKKGLRQLFKRTVKSAVKLEMVGFALQALDGTKIQAACSGYGNHDQPHLEKQLQQMDEKIAILEEEIEKENKRDRNGEVNIPKELHDNKRLREKVQKALEEAKAEDIRHCHPSDPEARRMKTEGRNRFSYNAQAVVDGENYIITAADVTQAQDDTGQLVEMGKQTGENSERNPDVLLADGGYVDGEQLAQAEKEGLEVLAPLPSESNPPEENPYHRRHFEYDQEADEFICPEGRRIPFRRERVRNKRTGKVVREYRNKKVCDDCPSRYKCTKDRRHGRAIELIPGYDARERLRERMEIKENKKKLNKRGQIVELLFAWIKGVDGFRRWSAHGVENAKTQWSVICTVWNLKQIYKKWVKGIRYSSAIVLV